MIPADILTILNILAWFLCALMWVCLAVLVYELLRWTGRAAARKRARLVEPDNCGDQGGHPTAVELHQAGKQPTAVEQQRHARPKAPQIGCGLPAGVRSSDQGGLPMPASPGDEFYYTRRKAGD